MSRHVVKTLLFLGGAVLFISVVAFAEKSKTINIYSDSVLPSGQTLKAGTYQVDVNEIAKQVTFKKGAKVIATLGCQIVEKPNKNTSSGGRFSKKDNKQQLQELRFDGEHRAILLVQGGL